MVFFYFQVSSDFEQGGLKMKTLVVFYSRTGTTRRVAEAISASLNCDREEIFDTKDRAGVWGYLAAGRDASLKRPTAIREMRVDPAAYDLVIVGTPVWAFTAVPAVRTFLANSKGRLKKVAFFCTQGGMGDKGAFRDMEETCGQKPLATLVLRTHEAMGDCASKVKRFVDEVNK
jgi:flavodoxin